MSARLLRRLTAYARVAPRARGTSAVRPLRTLLRRPALLAGLVAYELGTLVSNRVDLRLKYLAIVKTASRTGCPF